MNLFDQESTRNKANFGEQQNGPGQKTFTDLSVALGEIQKFIYLPYANVGGVLNAVKYICINHPLDPFIVLSPYTRRMREEAENMIAQAGTLNNSYWVGIAKGENMKEDDIQIVAEQYKKDIHELLRIINNLTKTPSTIQSAKTSTQNILNNE